MNKRKTINFNKAYHFLYWYIGINSVMHIFRSSIRILNYAYALALLLIVIRVFIHLWNGAKASSNIFYFKLLCFLISMGMSFAVSIEFFSRSLAAALPVILLYMAKLKQPIEGEYSSFILGLKQAILIDLIYAVFQGIGMLRDIDINHILFTTLNMNEDQIAQSDLAFHYHRLTGLIWDPFVIGMFSVIGFYLFRHKGLKILSLFILLFSSSRTSLLGLAVSGIYYYYPMLKKRKYFLFVVTALLTAVILVPSIVDLTRGFSKDSEGYKRIEYIILMPKVITHEGSAMHMLFGGTPVFTGARFYYSGIQSMVNNTILTPYWNIESDWFGIVYGQGLVGMAIYFATYFYILRRQKSRLHRAIVIAILFGGVGYFYDSAIYTNLLTFLPLYSKEDNKRILVKGKNE
jgi:hypothetical protein